MTENLQSAQTGRALELEFAGRTAEYFRVWIVNLCLTVLTLGVYSAWAKVRKKRYFYSHTRIDGTPLQYLGQPVPILKGRIVAVVLFIGYYLTQHLYTVALPYVLGAMAVAAPWVLVRSAAFNARYSAYRNMSFRFDGDYWSAFRVIHAWGLVPALTLGNAFQWWGTPMLGAGAFLVFGFLFPWWLRGVKAYLIERTSFGEQSGRMTARGGQFFVIYLIGGLIVMLVAIPFAVLSVVISINMHSPKWAMLALVPFYAGYVLAFAYIQARTANLIWNNATLGPLYFRVTQRGRDLAKLYIGNALAILVTLGLAIPWAVIRTMRYRAEHMEIALDGELSVFRGSETTAVRAAGAEIGEFFDLDVSL